MLQYEPDQITIRCFFQMNTFEPSCKFGGTVSTSILNTLYLVKLNFFHRGFFYIEGFHFYKVNIHFFCIFLDYFSNYFLLKLKLFRHNSYYNKYSFRNAPKYWQKSGSSLLQKCPLLNKFAFTTHKRFKWPDL